MTTKQSKSYRPPRNDSCIPVARCSAKLRNELNQYSLRHEVSLTDVIVAAVSDYLKREGKSK